MRRAAADIPRRCLLALLLTVATMAVAAIATPPALAGSGDFCSWEPLTPGTACFSASHSSYIELEGWNSDGKGVGSCIGVYNGGVKGETCAGNGSSYNEVYCSSSCANHSGQGFEQDNSQYNSVFTGWASW